MLREAIQEKQILCLMGPTATGKSDLAIQLAKDFPIEIISVDSAMVYKGMDIGTAKPDKACLAKIPHHLIDICDLNETYSAGQFCQEAAALIDKIQKRGHIPLLVGGTMLYFRALQQGLSELPKADAAIRLRLTHEDNLHEKLRHIDPVTAQRLPPNDKQRIIRALEVHEITGQPLSQWHAAQKSYLDKNVTFINMGLLPPNREKLKQRITERFHRMLDKGLMAEVESLWAYRDTSAMRSVGYRQVCDYLLERYDKNTMIQKAITATAQLAKRQMTWLRSFPSATLLEAENAVSTVSKLIRHLLS